MRFQRIYNERWRVLAKDRLPKKIERTTRKHVTHCPAKPIAAAISLEHRPERLVRVRLPD